MHLAWDDRTGKLARISSGDCAVEIEFYPELGVHILINTLGDEGEEIELWVRDEHGITLENQAASMPNQAAATTNLRLVKP